MIEVQRVKSLRKMGQCMEECQTWPQYRLENHSQSNTVKTEFKSEMKVGKIILSPY